MTVAEEAGVRKIVRVSALRAALDGPTDNTRQHGRTDNAIQSSGLTYVVLRPHFFMQNLFMSAQSIASDGNLYWSMGDGKLAIIDARDIVASVEQCVVSDDYDNQIMRLTEPVSISFQEIADSCTEPLGRPVNCVPAPLEAVEPSLREMGLGGTHQTSIRRRGLPHPFSSQ